MRALPALLVWLLLMLLLAAEVGAAALPGITSVVPFIGLVMAVIVALTFMRLGTSRGLMPVFAVAGVFWLCVMIGLGAMDPFTRHDVDVPAPGAAPFQ
jgi:cytochrome c oxidase subunit IV